jgi:hypothetical protein
MITTQAQIREAFWAAFSVDGKPKAFAGKSQNDLPTDVRCAFVDFVDALQKDGTITEALAARVTL